MTKFGKIANNLSDYKRMQGISSKTRGNYPVNVCLRKCKNKGNKCDECLRWSEYEPRSKD